MSNQQKPNPKDADDERGFKKPPKHSRFKPGQSGNRKGRPKKKKNDSSASGSTRFQKELLEELSRLVSFTENGKQAKLPKAQLIIRAVSNEAAKGKPSVAMPLMKMYKEVLDEERTSREQHYQWAVDYKRDWYACERNRRLHPDPSSVPLPLPYAAHVITNPDDLSVSIVGPTDEGELHGYKCTIAEMVKSEIDIDESELQGLNDEDSDIEVQRIFLAEARKLIPRDDPLWLEFAPGYKRAVIDHRYYYGPDPDLPSKIFEMPDDLKARTKEAKHKASPESRKWARQNAIDRKKFWAFMRKKLEELMGDEWETRLDHEFHESRDVDWDYTRWQYETGTFDRSAFGLTAEELEEIAGSEEEKSLFAWDRER